MKILIASILGLALSGAAFSQQTYSSTPAPAPTSQQDGMTPVQSGDEVRDRDLNDHLITSNSLSATDQKALKGCIKSQKSRNAGWSTDAAKRDCMEPKFRLKNYTSE